jgi:hypothetical protein
MLAPDRGGIERKLLYWERDLYKRKKNQKSYTENFRKSFSCLSYTGFKVSYVFSLDNKVHKW